MIIRSLAIAAFSALVLTSTMLVGPGPAEAGLTIPELRDQASIRRDSNGVPHIRATNEHDLILLQGWAHARDRLFQMDVLRRQASGTLAELVGQPALASDVELRTIGLRRAARRSLSASSAEARTALQAYAVGVNADASSHPLPLEYTPLERSFEPWTPIDSLVIGKLLAFALSFDLDIAPTLRLLTYAGTGEAAGFDGVSLYFEDTHRSAPFDPASTVPDAGGASTVGLIGRGLLNLQALTSLQPATLELGRRYIERISGISVFRTRSSPADGAREATNGW